MDLHNGMILASGLAGAGAISYALSRVFRNHDTLQRVFTIVYLVMVWWTSSTSLVIGNRIVFGKWKDINPTVVTTMHMALKALLGLIVLALSNAHMTPELALLNRKERFMVRWRRLVKSQGLTREVFWRLIVPIGVSTSVDVICSNYSLRYMDVSIYTVVKSTLLVWNVILSVCYKLSRLNFITVATVTLLMIGVAMSTYDKAKNRENENTEDFPESNLAWGVTLASVAGFVGAVRWVITQKYFERDGVQSHTLVLLVLIGPSTVASMLPFCIAEIVKTNLLHVLSDTATLQVFMVSCFGGGIFAMLLILAEIQLVKITSSITLNIIGHAKDAVVVLFSVLVVGEHLTLLNGSGVFITIIAGFLYTLGKKKNTTYKQLNKGEGGSDEENIDIEANSQLDNVSCSRHDASGNGVGNLLRIDFDYSESNDEGDTDPLEHSEFSEAVRTRSESYSSFPRRRHSKEYPIENMSHNQDGEVHFFIDSDDDTDDSGNSMDIDDSDVGRKEHAKVWALPKSLGDQALPGGTIQLVKLEDSLV